MELDNHILYIDVTQACGIGCTFCMYDDLHDKDLSHLRIGGKAKSNLVRLVNDPSLKRVSITGEGEPLNNTEAVWNILNLSGGKVSFELITSGFWRHKRLLQFLRDLQEKAQQKGDNYNIRLSTDSYHIPKLKNIPQGRAVRFFIDEKPPSLSLSFRSIWCDKEYTRKFLLAQVDEFGLRGEIEEENDLEDTLSVDGLSFPIVYKNLVNPWQCSRQDYMTLEEYIKAIEEKSGKPFTLGSINPQHRPNGLDVTIKPDGRVLFYGLEIRSLGNIYHNDISIEGLKRMIEEDPLFRAFYTRPFLELMRRISDDEEARTIIERVNNPYWVVKTLHEKGKLDISRIVA